MKYVKCPRCDTNYMPEGEPYCDVCKAELKIGPQIKFAALDGDDEQDQILCPVCKRNFIDEGEEMCEECREAQSEKIREDKDDVDPDNDEEWRNYLDEDEKEAISNQGDDTEEMLSLSQLGEEEAKKLFDDEEETEDDFYDDEVHDDEDEDDFEYPTDIGEYSEADEEEDEDEKDVDDEE